jgi:hypothetical protein
MAADDPRFEADLARSFDSLGLPANPPEASYLGHHGTRGFGRKPAAALAGLPALLGTKAVAAAALVTLAGTAVGVKAVVTGNADPTNWGPQVVQRVAECKALVGATPSASPSSSPSASPSPTFRNVGQCVSAFAKTHGKHLGQPSPSASAKAHGQGRGHGNGPPAGLNAPGHHGRPSGLPTPAGQSGTHPSH